MSGLWICDVWIAPPLEFHGVTFVVECPVPSFAVRVSVSGLGSCSLIAQQLGIPIFEDADKSDPVDSIKVFIGFQVVLIGTLASSRVASAQIHPPLVLTSNSFGIGRWTYASVLVYGYYNYLARI